MDKKVDKPPVEQRSRTILVAAIAVTICVAVFVSFGVPALTAKIPEVKLPDISQAAAGTGEEGQLPIDVTPATVQSVIKTLSRPENSYRELAVTLFWTADGQEGSASTIVQIWSDQGYTKTALTENGLTQYRLVGDGTLYLWYHGDDTWREMPAEETSADLAQRIPTYEDVLKADPQQIAAARYETRDGRDCIYVEIQGDGDRKDCYWIETATGLLYRGETLEQGKVVYEMHQTLLKAPMDEEVSFSLPDGKVLHTYSPTVVGEKDKGQG
ncbi:MAG: hypothetical protein SOR61_08405 [Evtepia sp.]|uniref:hypothetical protein n=1 Tax=Evtepia sp. TaxID=2773933 RepID=UPI002A757E6F|nr:hypothetical protein [Evtepia sp.]MDY3015180.1 hypothetical protein [Evtepia sp.]